MNINNVVFNFLNMLVQNFDKNLKFLFDMMSSERFQSIMNKRFKNAFAHYDTFHVNFSKIILIFLNVLSIIVNIKSNCFENVTMKSIAMILKNIVEIAIDINFSYVA